VFESGLLLLMRLEVTGLEFLYLGAQCLHLKGARTQVGRHRQAGFGGSLVQLSAIRLAEADGNAGALEVIFNERRTVGNSNACDGRSPGGGFDPQN